MKVLFHCHTNNSPCSNIKESDLITFLNKNKFDAVIVTDHNQITKINWSKGMVIPASEIATSNGDVIGIFLDKNIPKGLTIARTSELIHSQGGLVIAAHPSDILRREAMGTKTLLNNLKHFDIIETHNSRNLLSSSDKHAIKVARENNIPEIYGADAHTLAELKNCYLEMPIFSNQNEFMKSLTKALPNFKQSGSIPHIKTFFIKKTGRLQKHLK